MSKAKLKHEVCGGEVYLASVDAGGVPFSWYCEKCKKLWGFLEKPDDITYRWLLFFTRHIRDCAYGLTDVGAG